MAWNCRWPSGCQNYIEPSKPWDVSNAIIHKVKGIELPEKLLKAVGNGPEPLFQSRPLLSV